MLEDPGRPQFNEDRPVPRLPRGSRQPEVTIATCRPRPGSKTLDHWQPDLVISMPAEYSVPAGVSCHTSTSHVPTNFAEGPLGAVCGNSPGARQVVHHHL